ncbi:MAG: thiamine pyrophosphate-binding protein [Chloroflexota bacterium]|nr:thiamine pyrophosphate-binding protein [Chloroflexota bacterium]
MAEMSPSQAVVAGLKAQGVDTVFGLDGDHVIYLFDALADAPEIRPITVKHENNAAIAAEVYGRLTGRPGVCITTAGPGATNALSGVAGAYAQGAPLVHISGGVPDGAFKEAFHGVDRTDFLQEAFTPVTKWSVRVEDAADIPAVLTRAFALAVAGRPGPVHIEIPLSTLQSDAINVAADAFASTPRDTMPATGIDDAIRRIEGSQRVAIVVGKNAWWPAVSGQVVRLAERLGAPVAHSWDGHAAMPTVHPLSIGVYRGADGSHPAAYREVAEADLVLGIGVRAGTETAAQLAEQIGDRLLLIDATDEPDGALTVAAPSIAALAEAVSALAEECRSRPENAATLARCAHARESQQRGIDIELARYRDRRPWHIGVALDALATRMTPDILVVSDVSQVKLWTPIQVPAFNPESHLQPGSWGAMGYAVPGVLAAGLLRPDKKVVGVTGDASFQMACSDFGTICNLGLPVVIAVHADEQIGMIHHALRTTFGRTHATEIGHVDFVRYAEAFGARGIRVTEPSEIGAAWDEALAADGPVLLELRAGHDFPFPWPVQRLVEQAEA